MVACAGVTLGAFATALDIPVCDATVRAEGTLGVAKEVPVGFQRIRLHFDLESEASEEQIATLLRLTERYCVVYQSLRHPAQIEIASRTISK